MKGVDLTKIGIKILIKKIPFLLLVELQFWLRKMEEEATVYLNNPRAVCSHSLDTSNAAALKER